MKQVESNERIFAAMDIGTNSIRLAVIEMQSKFSWTTLSMQKQVVRLGEGEFTADSGKKDENSDEIVRYLTDEAMDRAALVCARFADMARGFGAERIVALATAASREAANRDEFVRRVRSVAGLDVRVISGQEEARLIYLGVSSAIDLKMGDKALFMDIGGGSTELIVGYQNTYSFLDSLRLGAIRLTAEFLKQPDKPVPPATWAEMQRHIKSVLAPAARAIRNIGFTTMYGSSGTAINMAEIAAHMSSGSPPQSFRNYVLPLTEVQAITKKLCALNIEQRRRVPGLNTERADIIIGGSAILQTVMEVVGASSLTISDRGLREGIIVDHLVRTNTSADDVSAAPLIGARRRSIQQLMKSTGVEEAHAAHIVRLSLMIFDEWKRLGLHGYSRSRELLEYAGLLHDCGFFISHTNHQNHSYYLIRNSELLGFNDLEVEIVASLALYHRKAAPRKRHPNFARLDGKTQRVIRILSCALRLAEALDRGHLMLVTGVSFARTAKSDTVEMSVTCSPEAQLELWAAAGQSEAFQKTFGMNLSVSAVA